MRQALAIAILLASPLAAQEFFTLRGHGGPIMDLAVSPDGQIASASFDNSVGLWDGTTPRWLEGHRAAVNAVTFGAAGRPISGGDDYAIWFWPGADGGLRIGQHQAKVTDIAWSETAGIVATASWDHSIGLWPLESEAGYAPNPSPDAGQFLKGHRQGVNDVAFSLDGARLYSASVDGTIRLWDVAASAYQRTLVKHGFGINTLIVDETAGWIAYGGQDGGTRIVDRATGAQIADFTLDRRPILSMAYHPDTRQLAVGDGQGYIMVIDTGVLKITRDFRATRQGPIWALAFSPDGQNIHAGGIEDIIYSWPVATMDEHGPMQGGTRSFLEKPETLPNGERQFKRKCSICHTLTEDSARKAGPSLYGVFGRKAGVVRDYAYSDTLKGSKIVWSAETINALFDLGPDHYIPGTKMPMQRIAKQGDRNDLIDFLRSATAETED
ncbi:c-type cytochrome [uncultured Tateyamaria sp.]|uniref:c-type cytochrome n=1 Tax=uncultured Tateyamaria sp. TaxID=455651 RepID=UPI002618D268|nr:c-type cytochrome [uncultured Tateyamaria sp.]